MNPKVETQSEQFWSGDHVKLKLNWNWTWSLITVEVESRVNEWIEFFKRSTREIEAQWNRIWSLIKVEVKSLVKNELNIEWIILSQ